jgi:hypothetical protein
VQYIACKRTTYFGAKMWDYVGMLTANHSHYHLDNQPLTITTTESRQCQAPSAIVVLLQHTDNI